MSSRRRAVAWARRLGLALVALELLYLLAGNLFLGTGWGRGVINRKPQTLSATWRSAWTSLPGLVHLQGLELGGASRRVSWHGTMERGHAWFWLPSLAARHVLILSGGATGVEVDVDVRPKSAPARSTSTRRGWRVTLGGMGFDDVRRLRVDDYELAGSGALRGWARFQVRGPMQLRLDRMAFRDAVVRSRGTEVARHLTVDAQLSTEPYRVGANDLGELLAGLDGSVKLQAAADNLAFLAAYLRKVPWLRLDGVGELAIDARVARGSLLPGSTLVVNGPEIEAELFDFTARGEGRVDGEVEAGGIRLGAVLTRFSLDRASDGAAILTGRDLEVRVSTTSTALDQPPEGLAGMLKLPPAQVPDLSVLDPYLPPGLQLRIDGGTADLSAELSFDTVADRGQGRLTIEGREVTGAFGDTAFSTALTLRAESPDLSLLAGRFDVAGSELVVDAARLVRAGRVRATSWSARVRLPSGRFTIPPPGRVDPATARSAVSLVADVEAEMRNTAPVVLLLEQRLPKLAWFDRLLTLSDVTLSGTLDAPGRALGLRSMRVTGGEEKQLEILADLDLDGPSTTGVAYVRYRALDASVALDGAERKWALVRARQKYQAALAEYEAARAAGG